MNDKGSRMGKLSKVRDFLQGPALDGLSVSKRAVLTVLWYEYAGNLNGDAALCWPSPKTIAHRVGCSEREVRRAFTALERRGLISKATDPEGRAVLSLCLTPCALNTTTAGGHDVRNLDTTSDPRGHDVRRRGHGVRKCGPDVREFGHDVRPIKEELSSELSSELSREPAAPPKPTWLRVILPDGMTVTPDDNAAARKLAHHVQLHYPSTLKIQHRPPVNQILDLAAPHLVAMAETHGSIAAACEQATRAVDAVADFARENPARAGFVYGLERWLSKGGMDYPDPLDFMPHLRPKAEARLTKMQEHEVGNHDERSWLDAG